MLEFDFNVAATVQEFVKDFIGMALVVCRNDVYRVYIEEIERT